MESHRSKQREFEQKEAKETKRDQDGHPTTFPLERESCSTALTFDATIKETENSGVQAVGKGHLQTKRI